MLCRSGPPIPPGAIGCYASHLRAYKQIIAERAGATLVLEDDADLDDDLVEVIRQTLAMLPAGWDMVHLGQSPRYAVKPLAALPNGRRLVRYSRIPSGTVGYLISLAGARKMLDPAVQRFWAIDLDTRRSWLFGRMSMVWWRHQSGRTSSLQHHHHRRPHQIDSAQGPAAPHGLLLDQHAAAHDAWPRVQRAQARPRGGSAVLRSTAPSSCGQHSCHWPDTSQLPLGRTPIIASLRRSRRSDPPHNEACPRCRARRGHRQRKEID